MDEKRYTLGQLIKRLKPFLRPYLPKYIAAVTLLITTSLLSLLPPYAIYCPCGTKNDCGWPFLQ